MILSLHDSFQKPLELQATRLLVRDEYGNPVALLLQMGPGHIRVLTAGQDDFSRLLVSYGLGDPPQVNHIR